MIEAQIWSLNKEQIEEYSDKVKTSVVATLVTEGALDTDLADEWCSQHSIILTKKNIFRTITDKWRKDESDTDNYLIKIIRLAR